jgi:hypothetical protein
MKITKTQLKQIIKEELGKISEADPDPSEPSPLAASIHGSIMAEIGWENMDQALQDGIIIAALDEVKRMFGVQKDRADKSATYSIGWDEGDEWVRHEEDDD